MMLTAVPPSIVPTDSVVCGGSKPLSGRARAFASPARRPISAMISDAATIALTPRSGALECPSRPMIRVRKNAQPFCRLATCIEVGSPMIASRGRAAPGGRARINAGAPKQPISSSWVKARCSGTASGRRVASGTNASTSAIKPFMSALPRP